MHVKQGRSGTLEVLLNSITTWDHVTWTFLDSTFSTSSSDSDTESLVLQHKTNKLDTTGQFQYSVQIQKQGSTLSCTGALLVYSK